MSSRKPNADQLDRFVAWTFGLAPAALFLLTWSDDFTPLQQMARAFALPVLAAELAVAIVSFGEGNRLGKFQLLPLVLLIGLAMVAWGTAITATEPAAALIRTGAWTIHVLFGLALVNLRRHDMLDFDRFVRAQLAGFWLFFALLVGFAATTTNSEVGAFDLPAFGSVRWFGYYAAAVVGLSAIGLLRGDKFALLTAAAAFAMAFWTGTRGGVAAAILGLAACAMLLPQFRSWRVCLLVVLVAVAGLAWSFCLNAVVPLDDQGPYNMARFGSSGRVELWQSTLEKVLERPLLGRGEGQFRYAFATFTVAQPHNIILQLLYVWGIVGALLCAALAVWLAPRFLKNRSGEAAPFQCAALILAAYSFIDGALFYVQSTSLFALCCASAVAAGRPKEPAASDPSAN